MTKQELLKSAKECLDKAKSSEEYAVNGSSAAKNDWRKIHLRGARELTKTAKAYIMLAMELDNADNN